MKVTRIIIETNEGTYVSAPEEVVKDCTGCAFHDEECDMEHMLDLLSEHGLCPESDGVIFKKLDPLYEDLRKVKEATDGD